MDYSSKHSKNLTIPYRVFRCHASIWIHTRIRKVSCFCQLMISTSCCSQIWVLKCASNDCQYWKFNNILETGMYFNNANDLIELCNLINFLWLFRLQWSSTTDGYQSKSSICKSARYYSLLYSVELYGSSSRSTASKAIAYKLGNELGDNVIILSPKRNWSRYSNNSDSTTTTTAP